MNSRFFVNRIEGNWVIQNTNYSLINNTINTSINQISWKQIKNTNNEIDLILKNIMAKFYMTNSSIYIMEYNKNERIEKFYKFFLYDKKTNTGNILKLNHSGNIVSKASFNYENNKYLYINYQHDGFNITEKIYFINHNLKIVKSIIKKNAKCIGISFSSEIKIG